MRGAGQCPANIKHSTRNCSIISLRFFKKNVYILFNIFYILERDARPCGLLKGSSVEESVCNTGFSFYFFLLCLQGRIWRGHSFTLSFVNVKCLEEFDTEASYIWIRKSSVDIIKSVSPLPEFAFTQILVQSGATRQPQSTSPLSHQEKKHLE